VSRSDPADILPRTCPRCVAEGLPSVVAREVETEGEALRNRRTIRTVRTSCRGCGQGLTLTFDPPIAGPVRADLPDH
jgi:hypothetical protein